MSYQPEFLFDENLRDVPKDPAALKEHVQKLQASLESMTDPDQAVGTLGEMGVYLRTLGELDWAEECLLEAFELIQKYQLGVRREVQQMIRLAHVLQWKKDFVQSNQIFDEILEVCRNDIEARVYLDFALQHAGKNFFDQEKYPQALSMFEQALEIRRSKNAPESLIQSALVAIEVTEERISSTLE